jgi:hypothetical protein
LLASIQVPDGLQPHPKEADECRVRVHRYQAQASSIQGIKKKELVFFVLETALSPHFYSIPRGKERRKRARLCKAKRKLSRLDVLFYYLYSKFAIPDQRACTKNKILLAKKKKKK